jgi:hypothetical protein
MIEIEIGYRTDAGWKPLRGQGNTVEECLETAWDSCTDPDLETAFDLEMWSIKVDSQDLTKETVDAEDEALEALRDFQAFDQADAVLALIRKYQQARIAADAYRERAEKIIVKLEDEFFDREVR